MDLEYPGPCHHHLARLTAPTTAARSAFVPLARLHRRRAAS
jgi:hypothetical protein